MREVLQVNPKPQPEPVQDHYAAGYDQHNQDYQGDYEQAYGQEYHPEKVAQAQDQNEYHDVPLDGGNDSRQYPPEH